MSACKWRGVVAGIVGIAVVGAGARFARTCIPEMYDGVHFNTEVPDFGVPPQVAVIPWLKNAPARKGGVHPMNYDYDAEWAERKRLRHLDHVLVREARTTEHHGQYRKAVGAYRRLISEGIGTEAYWRDRIEVLGQAIAKGAPSRLADYLRARNRLERGNLWPSYLDRIKTAMRSIANDPKAGFLRPHALYTIAAIDWSHRKDAQTAGQFAECAKRYPGSPRAESALIMAVRTLLGERAGKPDASKAEFQLGRAYATALLVKYPHTRFRDDALGWIGRVEYLMGRYASARAFYRRQLAAGGSIYGTTESIADCYNGERRFDQAVVAYLRLYGSRQTPEEKESAVSYISLAVANLDKRNLALFCRALRSDMPLLQAYLEYRLYFTRAKPKELANLVELADAALRRHPHTRLNAAIGARLAEISYVRKRYQTAYRYACHAIASASTGSTDLDLAWYVKASASSKMGRSAAALQAYETLLRRFPKSRLVPNVRENMALAFERLGRLGDALRQYVKLGYKMDAAYLLDVKMTPRQVELYARSCPPGKERDLAVYSLGVRYLRTNRFAAALRELHRIPNGRRRDMAGLVPHKKDEWWDLGYRSYLRDPAWTAAKLSRLHLAIRKAREGNPKARAIYALAAFIVRQGNLVFYNKPAWDFTRSMSYGFYWNPYVASKSDWAIWRKHCYQHEAFARGRALCLELVHRYPRSTVAARATYTAATCCDHLSRLNPWWREENDRVHLDAQSVRLMKLVVSRYPKSKLRKAAAKYAGVFASEEREREPPYWKYRLKWDRERRAASE